ncbi:hypothetical protein RINTHM_10160 [Richelia intracellularis HM01]|nr:hypothetical protein RINTHM_10160 [Richelia intracellularis HM01]
MRIRAKNFIFATLSKLADLLHRKDLKGSITLNISVFT